MKTLKKLFCALLSIMMLVGTSCNNDAPVASITSDDVEVWTAPATEKILQNQDLYDDMKSEKAISLLMAKNEYESGQVIITAKKDVAYYDISVSDLVMAGTNNKIKRENITVYNEKYIDITAIYDTYGMPPQGMYPDALLPFDAAKKYGENRVKESENQGIYITVKTTEEQEAGLYTGNVTVDFKDFTVSVPVFVQVANVTVSEERHAKNIYLTGWQRNANAELEATERLYDAYNEMLFRYRLSPNTLQTNCYQHDETGRQYYVDKAFELMQDVRCSNITIPYEGNSYYSNYYGGYVPCFELNGFEAYIRAFAEKSFENDFNMFAKLVCYFGFLDELNSPTAYNIATVKYVYEKYTEILNRVASEYENDATKVATNKEEIIESIRKIRNVQTTWYKEEYKDYVDTWCPLFNWYAEATRDDYANQEEKWWYGCNTPRAPYPTYHIEDSLLSARVMSWIQSEYDIVGNLYWAVDLYGIIRSNGTIEPLEDYYSTANRGNATNGEGFLFYPGGQYGLEYPVASLRLEAIRDGLEEYELLYALKERYAELSMYTGETFSADKLIELLNADLHSDVKVKRNTGVFFSARQQLFELLECAESPAGMAIVDYTSDGYENVGLKVLVLGENNLEVNGQSLGNFETVANGRIYTIDKKLDQDKNEVELCVEAYGATYSYSRNLGGKVSYITADSLVGGVSVEDVVPQASLVDVPAGSGLEGKLVQINAPASGVDSTQSVRLSNSIFSTINSNTSKLILHVYVPTAEDEFTITISAAYTKNSMYIDVAQVALKQGLNAVEIPLSDTNWTKLGALKYFVLYFNADYDQPARTVYLQNMVVYNV